MATLGRSLKSPSGLMRAGRPSLARALSSSSEVSVASADSGRDDEHMDFVMSAPNTPFGEPSHSEAVTSIASEATTSHSHRAPLHESAGATLSLKPIETSSLQAARTNRARPIAIDLPQIRKYNSAPNHTPPEPLSARGDKPGGYFPLHEDPKARVHRFQPASNSRHPHPTLQLPPNSTAPSVQKSASRPVTMSEPVRYLRTDSDNSTSMSSNTPVASYIPSGAHDTSLPMGKYYPSNYEQSHRPALSTQSSQQHGMPPPPPPIGGVPSSVKSDSQLLVQSSEFSEETEARRKLQQYQRDMIAQARLAANQVLGDGVQPAAPLPPATVSLNGVPLRGLHHLGMTSVHRPISPRLLPLGSPGPVTPMDLEGGESSYLDRARAPMALSQGEEMVRALRAEAAFMRREGKTSPAIETGPQPFF